MQNSIKLGDFIMDHRAVAGCFELSRERHALLLEHLESAFSDAYPFLALRINNGRAVALLLENESVAQRVTLVGKFSR